MEQSSDFPTESHADCESSEAIHDWCHLKPLGLICSAERDGENKADPVFVSKDSPPPGMSQRTCVYLTCN